MSMQPAGRKSKLSAITLASLLVSSVLLVLPFVATPVAAVAPVVVNQWYQDTDCNGHVDAVTLRMSMIMHDVSIRPSDFRINHGILGFKEGNGFMTGVPVSLCDANINNANRPPAGCGAANNDCFTLLFPEGLVPDAGPQSNGNPGFNPPAISFVNDPNAPAYAHDDPVGSKMTNLGSCTTTCRIDASPPILMAAYGKSGDSFITVVFSENVAVTAGGANSMPSISDICVVGGPAGTKTVNSFPVNNVPNRVYRVHFTDAAGVPQTIANDDVLNAMQVYVGADLADPAPDCSTLLGDSNNPAAHNVIPYKRVFVGAPTVNRIYANSGDEQLIAEFNGPVWDGSSQIPGNSFAVSAAGGSGITGHNNNIIHAGGADRALLTTTSPPNLADVAVMGTTFGAGAAGQLRNDNTNFLGTVVGSILQITSGAAAGTYTVTGVTSSTILTHSGTTVTVPVGSNYILSEPGARIHINAGKVVGYRATGVQEPESSTDGTPGCADNVGPTPPALPLHRDFCLVDAFNSFGAPHVERFITQDANSDGCLDNIKLEWNENILDASFSNFNDVSEAFPQGPWQVIFPGSLGTPAAPLSYGDAAGSSSGQRRPAYMVTSDPGTLAPSANDHLTYLVFSGDCGGVRATGVASGGDTNTLQDTNVGATIGSAQTGDVLQITSGASAGSYSVVAVGATSVDFLPATASIGPCGGANPPCPAYIIRSGKNVGDTGALPVVSFCDGMGDAGRTATCTAAGVMTDLRGNRMLSGSVQGGAGTLVNFIFRHPTVDGAKPVATYASAQDDSRNGYIDRIVVGFSEGVTPASVDKNTWTATIRAPLRAGCPLADGTPYTLLAVDTDDSDPTNGATPTIGTSLFPAPTIEFTVAEKSGLNPYGDTGCVPDLTYNGAIRESSTRTAGAPQTMNAIVAGGACPVPPSIGGGGPFANNVLCESDRAAPVFKDERAIAAVDTNVAVVTFSEPVFGSGTPVTPGSPAGNTCGLPSQDPLWPSGLLTPSDFSYDDESNGGVTGITAVTMVGTDCRKWQLTLNGALTAADVDGAANPDCLRSRKTSTTVSAGIRDGMPAAAMPSAPSQPRIGQPAVPTEDQFDKCIKFTQGPPPLCATCIETVDSDHNGGIDALRLTFASSVSDPFAAVIAGDSDIAATISPPAQSSGHAMCWVNLNPLAGTNSATVPQAEDLLYADASGTCSGNVAAGDFRYSALPTLKPVASAVGGTDPDVGVAFASTTLLRVRTPGTSVAPNAQDKLYFDADGSGSITVGDRRLSGFDERFWDVSIGGVAQIVTGVSTGQLDRVYSGTATSASAVSIADTSTGRDFLLLGILPGMCVTVGGQTSVITAVAATTLTITTMAPAPGAGSVYTIGAPWHGRAPSPGVACVDVVSPINAPSGTPCHDSDDLLPNQAGDAILFVCIEEERDGQGRLRPNTGATTFEVGYSGNTIVRTGAENPGSPIGLFSQHPVVDAAQPVLVKAEVTTPFGSSTARRDVILTFSEPVVRGDGSKNLKPEDFSYVNGNSASAECIEGASSVAASYEVDAPVGTSMFRDLYLRLDAPLSVHDMGGALAGGTPPCTNPPDSLRAIPTFVREAFGPSQLPVFDQAVTFTEDPFTAGPRIESAGFVDADGDGIIDAVQVKFNEFIHDLAKVDAVNRNDWGVRVRTGGTDQSPVFQTMEVLDLTTGQLGGAAAAGACMNTYSVTTGTGAIPVSLRLLPYNATRTPSEVVPIAAYGAGANDNYVFLCLNPDKVLANGGTKVAGTGLTGSLTYTGTPASRLSDVFAAPGFPTGSPLADIPSGAALPIIDMARPVVLNECRHDTFLDHPGDALFTAGTDVLCPNDTGGRSVETADRNRNGAIDSMRILLSEPVVDTTVNVNQWSVSNVANLGVATGPEPLAPTMDNDNEIFLTFTEASDSNSGIGRATSGSVPDVSYFSGGSLADKAATPNLLRGIASGACTAPATGCADERDGAAPTIRQIAAQPGTNLVTVRFSEKVGSGTHGTGLLTSAQVAYSNAGGSGASAITSMSHAGDTLTLTLNGNLDQADVDNDRLVFTDNSIFEEYCGPETDALGRPFSPTAYPHVYPLASARPSSCYRELELAVALRTLNNIVGSPPTAPALTLVTSDADSASFSWTVPTDPDNDLAGYELSYCVCPVFFAGGASTVNVPLGAAPSREVTDLVAGSQYTFVVRGVDAAGNRGPDSNSVQVTPEADDDDAPCAITTLDAGTTTTTSVVLSWTTPKEDCGSATSDGPSGYIVAGATGSISSNAAFDAAVLPGSVLSFQPASPTAPGTLQTVTVSGLQSGQTYVFSVKAFDDALPPNRGDLGNTVSADITGGTGNPIPGAILGLQAVPGDSPATQVKLKFTAPGKDGLTGTVTDYDVFYSENAISTGSPGDLAGNTDPGTLVGPGQSQEITVRGLKPETTYNFTVRAKDGGQLGPVSGVARLKTAAGAAINLEGIQADFARTVRVSHSGGTNTITWGDPPKNHPDLGDAIGVQIWKLVDGQWIVLEDIEAGTTEFDERSFQDEGTASDRYKATVYFSDDAEGGYAQDPSDISNFDDLPSASAESKILGLDTWLFWLLLGILVLIIIAVSVLLALRARRGRASDMGEDDEELAEGEGAGAEGAEGEALPDMPAEDLPLQEPGADVPVAAAAVAAPAASEAAPAQPQGTPDKHYLTCPKCATEFSAFGIKPLAIQCPNCGVRGTLR